MVYNQQSTDPDIEKQIAINTVTDKCYLESSDSTQYKSTAHRIVLAEEWDHGIYAGKPWIWSMINILCRSSKLWQTVHTNLINTIILAGNQSVPGTIHEQWLQC